MHVRFPISTRPVFASQKPIERNMWQLILDDVKAKLGEGDRERLGPTLSQPVRDAGEFSIVLQNAVAIKAGQERQDDSKFHNGTETPNFNFRNLTALYQNSPEKAAQAFVTQFVPGKGLAEQQFYALAQSLQHYSVSLGSAGTFITLLLQEASRRKNKNKFSLPAALGNHDLLFS